MFRALFQGWAGCPSPETCEHLDADSLERIILLLLAYTYNISRTSVNDLARRRRNRRQHYSLLCPHETAILWRLAVSATQIRADLQMSRSILQYDLIVLGPLLRLCYQLDLDTALVLHHISFYQLHQCHIASQYNVPMVNLLSEFGADTAPKTVLSVELSRILIADEKLISKILPNIEDVHLRTIMLCPLQALKRDYLGDSYWRFDIMPFLHQYPVFDDYGREVTQDVTTGVPPDRPDGPRIFETFVENWESLMPPR